jgi:hypothetical protein
MNHPAVSSRHASPNSVRLQLIDGNQIVNVTAAAIYDVFCKKARKR